MGRFFNLKESTKELVHSDEAHHLILLKNAEVLQKIQSDTEKYRTQLIGEGRLFDLESFLVLAKEKKQKLEKSPTMNKQNIADCHEYIKLVAEELKHTKSVMKKKPKNPDALDEALSTLSSQNRLTRMNELSDFVIGDKEDVSREIARDKKLNAELEVIKNKMSAVIILVNILDCLDADVAKISQLALHARSTSHVLKDRHDQTWTKFWKTLESKAKPFEIKTTGATLKSIQALIKHSENSMEKIRIKQGRG